MQIVRYRRAFIIRGQFYNVFEVKYCGAKANGHSHFWADPVPGQHGHRVPPAVLGQRDVIRLQPVGPGGCGESGDGGAEQGPTCPSCCHHRSWSGRAGPVKLLSLPSAADEQKSTIP